MKRIKMILSAAVVVASVSGALAFKPLGAGSIYCIPTAQVSLVNTALACNNAAQPAMTKIDYRVSTNPAHPTTNPCPVNQTPFDNSLSNQCIQKTPGTDRFTTTLP